jgi:hypothetical protein
VCGSAACRTSALASHPLSHVSKYRAFQPFGWVRIPELKRQAIGSTAGVMLHRVTQITEWPPQPGYDSRGVEPKAWALRGCRTRRQDAGPR